MRPVSILSKSVLLLLTLLFFFSCEVSNVEGPERCDPEKVSFSEQIMPIIEQSCFSTCHNGTAPLGKFVLETYEDVRKKVDEGRFLGAIRQEEGFVAMPLRGVRLEQCKIEHIEVWIAEGAEDN